jgi:hypothetical protein
MKAKKVALKDLIGNTGKRAAGYNKMLSKVLLA